MFTMMNKSNDSTRAQTESAAYQMSPSHPLSNIFFGPHGIRAGWSALIFIAIFLLLGGVTRMVLHLFARHHENGPTGVVPLSAGIGELLALGITLGATAIMARLEGQPFYSYGLGGRKKLWLAFVGAGWGFLFISILVGGLYFTHNLTLNPAHLSPRVGFEYGAGWLLAMIVIAFFEETLLRGYLQWTLARGIGFWWSALLLSLSFALLHGHNPGESPIGLIAAGAIGLVFCLSVWYTGSLWWAIGFHATWDWGESYFYGTPNSGMVAQGHLLTARPLGKLWMSGGATGPEGSLLVLPVILLVALAVFLTLGPRVRWSATKDLDRLQS
jgi:uncharacterized protein